MARGAGTHHLSASLPQLLSDQTRDHPTVADRLRTILAQRETTPGHPTGVLDYLTEQGDLYKTLSYARRR